LNPELTLNEVVKITGITQKTISAVLNQHAGKSFNEFVNEYRVEEVKRRLSGSYPEHLTITGIALECGFNSQATFQRTFKQFTGVSPTEFLAKQSLKTA
jgi:AraC-like DNA-binding protein